MAISHVQPLLLLLLASLFLLPALRAVELPFEVCGRGDSLVTVSSVNLIPHPILANVQISGYTSTTITEGKMRMFVKVYGAVAEKTFDVCELVACPVAPGAIMFLFNRAVPYVEVKVEVAVLYVRQSPKIMCVTFEYKHNDPVAVTISA
ncbi:hypothetical protein AALP_AA8G001900 [Arabis alpina]|uniref:MD-2-related lipid-recognition domain-containing protein n=1 Tax=Arabis alpina TaxID=50452 RepID=A0A087G411_ARAAL|nr:hypothetical protein AALP_AA8G001900 [Arabis alpina]